MSSKITHISSLAHFETIQSSNNYLVADFHADWCGPCKAIAPIFDSLASAHSKPGKLAFVKIDVDACQDVAKKYGVSAMPTFLSLHGEKTVNALRGADPAALRRLVLDAAEKAEKSVSQSFASGGRTLGSSSSSDTASGAAAKTVAGRRALANPNSNGWSWASLTGGTTNTASTGPRTLPQGIKSGDGWYTFLVRMVMLYLTTLFSFDPEASAMASPYRRTN